MPQSFANVLIHFIFSTKNREGLLSGKELRDRTHAYLAEVLKDLKTPALVHQVCSLYSSGVAKFGRMRDARRANTRCGLQPTSNKASGQKSHSPSGWGGAGVLPRCWLVK